MFENEQINVSMKTILTHFLFEFKANCDTLALLAKNMILLLQIPSHQWQPATPVERTLIHEKKPSERKRPARTTDWITQRAWLPLGCRDEPIAKRIIDDHSS